MKTAIELIAEERQRQIAKGWTPEHDAECHAENQELLWAAGAYLEHVTKRGWVHREGRINNYQTEAPNHNYPDGWGWSPKSPLEDLVKVAALIEAEITRQITLSENETSAGTDASGKKL